MATHSSVLAWEIPWTEKPGRLQSMGSQRVRHDWVTKYILMIGCIKGLYYYSKWSGEPKEKIISEVLLYLLGIYLGFWSIFSYLEVWNSRTLSYNIPWLISHRRTNNTLNVSKVFKARFILHHQEMSIWVQWAFGTTSSLTRMDFTSSQEENRGSWHRLSIFYSNECYFHLC